VKFGIIITMGDPRTAADLAAEAEAAGWDGVFYWDGVALGDMDTYDPWVVMAAMAMRTERVTLGAIVTPPSRRRPWKLARETMTLDHLSGGRLVVPVGLGAVNTFGDVGEVTDRKVRAAMLDESLEILTGLWSGEPFAFSGAHYQVGEMAFCPAPIQRPRPPIWVVAAWPRPRSMARALRYDGILPNVFAPDGSIGERHRRGTPRSPPMLPATGRRQVRSRSSPKG
jgi:alkanesulfonate monooxygenase SsuD/methylene tetrahydromethanopterin reductase-like flavin-dependent oxidoreductase (luciferase family)